MLDLVRAPGALAFPDVDICPFTTAQLVLRLCRRSLGPGRSLVGPGLVKYLVQCSYWLKGWIDGKFPGEAAHAIACNLNKEGL